MTRAVVEPQLRVPPHSIEAEQSILGALMLDNAAFDRVGDLITEADFYRHEHRHIFVAIADLSMRNVPFDVVAVFERLQRAGRADDVGGLAYLNALAMSVPSANAVRRHAEIVRERAVLRRVIAAADAAATIAFRGGAEIGLILDEVRALWSPFDAVLQRNEPVPIGNLVARAVDRYNSLSRKEVEPGLPTGIEDLDRILGGGLKPGRVLCLAARPSVGKSSLARAIAIHVAQAGHRVLLHSAEMPNDEVVDCAIAQLGAIDSEHVQNGEFDDFEWGSLAEAVDRTRDLPLYLDDEGGATITQIRAKARQVKPKLLVVDYLQLCRAQGKHNSKNDEVSEISRGIKSLALELKMPVILLSQLNREVEKRGDKEPQISDLRDSGAIEQDADAILLGWTIEERREGASRVVGWKMPKNRGGKKGRFALHFAAPIYRWTKCDFPPQSPKSGPGGVL